MRNRLLAPRLGDKFALPLLLCVLFFLLRLQVGLRRVVLLSQLENLLPLLQLVLNLIFRLLNSRLLDARTYLVRGRRFDIALHPNDILCRILHFGVEYTLRISATANTSQWHRRLHFKSEIPQNQSQQIPSTQPHTNPNRPHENCISTIV